MAATSGVAHANNTFASATVISGNSGTLSGQTNVGTTGEAGEPTTYGGGSLNTMWYTWTAPGNGQVTLQTCGTIAQTPLDTTMQTFTGVAVNALAQLATNDDTTGCAAAGNPNYGSRNIVQVTQGTAYKIQIDGYGSATNTFRLNWNFVGFTIAKVASVATIAAPGTVTYTITVANVGTAALTAPAMTDALTLSGNARTLTSGPTYSSGDADSDGQVDTTETWIYAATFAVPQSDINLGGTYSNTATFDTAQTNAYASNAATTSITQTSSIQIVKSWLFAIPAHDLNSNGLADLGDTITYRYDVENIGNVTLTNVVVADSHGGSGPPPTPDDEAMVTDVAPALDSTDVTSSNELWSSLAPNDIARFTGTYIVTQPDFDNQ